MRQRACKSTGSALRRRVKRERGSRRAMVLVIVLFVVVVLALSAYTFTELMLTHYDGVKNSTQAAQARALVDSGVDTLKLLLLQGEATNNQSGGLFDNPGTLRGVVVAADEDPLHRGCFSILAPALDSQGNVGGIRFGLEDESTRLNLNLLLLADKAVQGGGQTLLTALPGMTPDIADAILDWLDSDAIPRAYGCEAEYYSGLQPPYQPKNGPLDTVEELLLVRGVTPTLLFGLDSNRNGILDPHEAAANQAVVNDPSLGALTRGWAPYLTLYSAERNVNSAGSPRINLNQEDLEKLYNELSQLNAQWATFIVAYRQSGPYEGEEPGEMLAGEPDFQQAGQTQISSVLDLIGKKTQVRLPGSQQPIVMASPFPPEVIVMATYLPTWMDSCTVNPSPIIPGRININQAPRPILMGIPGMTPEIVDLIVDLRPADPVEQSDNASMNHESWLLTEGVLFNEQGEPDIEKMKALLPFCCTGGDVYRAQVVGYFPGGGASSRAEVVIDNTGPVPRVVFWRDLSHLGRGFSLETLGVDLSASIY